MKTLIRALLALAIAACAFSARAAVITDIAGRKVETPAKVQRILLGEGRLFYSLALLEGKAPQARLAGWQGDFRQLDPQTYAQYKKRFPEIDRIPLIGNTSESSVNAEKVLTLRPDIAIFSLSGHGPGVSNPIVKQLQAAKVPVVFVDFRDAPLEHTIPSLRIMGKALQREAEAERFIRFYQTRLDAIRQASRAIPAAQKPKVFLDLRAGAFPHVASAGKGSLGELVDAAGGVNIGDALLPTPLGEINMEKVLALQPDWYIGTGSAEPGAAAGIQFGPAVSPAQARASLLKAAARSPVGALKAVRQGRTLGAWHHFYNTPYHIVLLEAFAKTLQPQTFAKLDPEASWKQLHRDFLAIEPQGVYWVKGKP
ncbi:ABC transporter substrate-binding protein [Chromobacterium sp. IIBBL 290-4]|uniref:ABC transporter substrate-binding protein n=1 Tax=Chromobacterium sp. IIBBL 290-4 TaxID=2953890 RepID=UPI0020B84B17|nr:ABC transporter substrate-binding protein [Chromobacterium sp. IIBBL 290-4]UTH76694.1 ABC transporter substrate-binding protein [Chromobacterium sp. IIBBL 290-4]